MILGVRGGACIKMESGTRRGCIGGWDKAMLFRWSELFLFVKYLLLIELNHVNCVCAGDKDRRFVSKLLEPRGLENGCYFK